MRISLHECVHATVSHETAQLRSWSDGARISRADAAVVHALDEAIVDAVFEEPSLSFINEAADSPPKNVQTLSAQLTALESQCSKLRKLLELAVVGSATR